MNRSPFDARTSVHSICFSICLLASSVITLLPIQGDSKTSNKPKPKPTQVAIAIPAYAAGPCDASDVLNLIAKDGPMNKAPKHANDLLKARIAECNAIIDKYLRALPTPMPTPSALITKFAGLPALPAPTGAPTSPPGCRPLLGKPELMQTYATLDYCAGWITRYVASPTPGTTPTPAPIVFHTLAPHTAGTWLKTVYVLALASDAPSSAQISLQLANELRNRHKPLMAKDLYLPEQDVQYQIVAAPAWTLAQYQQQCFADPSTAGAVVVTQPGTQSSAWNALLSASWTAVGFQTLTLDCEPTNTSYINNAAYITSVSNVNTATARRYGFSLASALAVLEGFLVFHPTHTDTYTVATPNPLPTAPAAYKTQYTTSSNQQGAGVVAAAGVAALTPLSQTTLFQGPGPDAQFAKAVQGNVLKQVLPDLFGKCTPRTPGSAAPGSGSIPQADQCTWFTP